jgi:hypothetical protein
VRLKPDENGNLAVANEAGYPYIFDVSALEDRNDVVVTAKLRFRHLPPYFIRALDAEHDELDRVPDGARIDPDALLENMVIDDLVEALSGDGPQLACEGPQNDPGATVLDCVEEDGDEEEARATASAGSVAFPEGAATIASVALTERHPWIVWLLILTSFSGAVTLLRLRSARPRP